MSDERAPAPTTPDERIVVEHQQRAIAPIAAATAFWAVFLARGIERADGTWYYSLFDDAMISMRYARHAAEGHGLVWNVGEAPVEGYSNLLWTGWMTLLHLTGLEGNVIALLVALSGAGILLTTMLVVRSIARIVSDGDPRVVSGSLWLFAGFYPLAFWSLRGMEVSVVAFVLAATVRELLRANGPLPHASLARLGALAAVGVLTRPDTAGFLVLIGVVAFMVRPALRSTPAFAVIFGAPVAAYAVGTALRLHWYNELVPLTYALKVGGHTIVERAGRGALVVTIAVLAHLSLAIVGGALTFVRGPNEERSTVAILASPMVAALGYCMWTGGDAWEWMNYVNRFIAPAAPMLFVAAALCTVRILDTREPAEVARGIRATAILLFVLAGFAASGVLSTGASLAEKDGAAAVERSVVLLMGATILLVALATANRNNPRAFRRRISHAALLAVLAISSLPGLWHWVPSGGREMLSDKRTARTGTLLAEAVPPNTSVAVVHAGNLSYFSMLPAIDLLGKNDPVIAHSDPHVFYPGHSKWDFEHSIVDLRPAILLQLVDGYTAEDRARLPSLGYVELSGGVFVDPERVDADAVEAVIRQSGWDGPEVSGT